MDTPRAPRRRVKPRVEDSRKTGWSYRGLFPHQQGEVRNAAGYAWIHALGMMPGVPDLEPWQEQNLLRLAQSAKTIYAQMHWLRKQQLIDKGITLVSEAAIIEAINMGPLVAQTGWWDGFDIPDGKGFMRPAGRQRRHAYAICGYSEPRQAFRIMNSRGQGWGQLGRAWIARDVFQRLWPDAIVIFPVATGVPWSQDNIDFMDTWEREHAETGFANAVLSATAQGRRPAADGDGDD
jgi:hypothetical protein